MSKIDFDIKYSDLEYKSAIREKLETYKYKSLHIFLPGISSTSLYFLSIKFDQNLLLVVSFILLSYALFSLVLYFYSPQIGLFFAKREKLKYIYSFSIDSSCIKRKCSRGEIFWLWDDVISLDFLKTTIFINGKKGSMLIPIKKLTEDEIYLLNTWFECKSSNYDN